MKLSRAILVPPPGGSMVNPRTKKLVINDFMRGLKMADWFSNANILEALFF